MSKFNSYWPVYKNLEEETLELTKYIQFSDEQLGVYSMHIADLIMRIVVEIEALSKELYKINNGPEVYDIDGNIRNLFFDTDCIKYLNDKWGICNRDIIISCAKFDFIDEKYKIFKPLKKANNRGDKSAKWNKAYQAIKHDRRNNLKKGNIENLIQALGALFILNIYYRNERFEYSEGILRNSVFDSRLGSDIFAVTFVDVLNVKINEDDSENLIDYEKQKKLSSAIYMIKYVKEDWKKMNVELEKFNEEIFKNIIVDPELIKRAEQKLLENNSKDSMEILKETMSELQEEYIRNKPPIALGRIMINGRKEVVLNKGQKIYEK